MKFTEKNLREKFDQHPHFKKPRFREFILPYVLFPSFPVHQPSTSTFSTNAIKYKFKSRIWGSLWFSPDPPIQPFPQLHPIMYPYVSQANFLSSYPSCIYHIFILMLLLTEFLLLKTPFLLPHVLKFQLYSSLKVQVNPLSSIDHLWFLLNPWEKLFLQYMSGPKLGWWIQS